MGATSSREKLGAAWAEMPLSFQNYSNKYNIWMRRNYRNTMCYITS